MNQAAPRRTESVRVRESRDLGVASRSGDWFALPFRLLRGFLAICVVLGAGVLARPASAAPAYRAFLDGLQERRYYDMALVYLDQLEKDSTVPAEIQAIVDYERAVTLIGMARASHGAATQTKLLDEATAALERFVKEHPNHALVAEAQAERGNILLGKARVAILESKAPGNEGRASKLRTDARSLLSEAKKIFDSAQERFEKKWRSFGPFIDEDDQERRNQRNAALNSLIESRLHLAECTYREAQTYPRGSEKRNSLLDKAAAQYKKVYQDHRSQIGGLYARLWMGKCYEEQAPRPEDGEKLSPQEQDEARQMLNIAEAIYSELLEHNATDSPSAARMQAYAFWFKMIVRNHPALHDYHLVVDLATEWLKPRSGSELRTVPARGIRWERAQAYESLANARDVPEGDRARLLDEALKDASFVNTYGGEFRDVSRAMIQRVKAALGRGEGDPDNFDAANGLGQTLQNQIAEKQKAVREAKSTAAKKKAQQALADHLQETARILKLALSLAEPSTPRSAVNAARYRLAYVAYQRDRLYNSAVLGSYVGRKFKNESPQIALESSYLAMAAFYKLYDQAEASAKDFALAKLRETADFIAKNFPDSEQANESRMMLGRLYVQTFDFQQAAKWFSQVPASSSQAREARMLAGRAFWDAYVTAQNMPEESRPRPEELSKLRASAKKFLQEGLVLAAKQLPAEAKAPEDVVAGKITLARINNLDGQFQKAVDLLTGQPRPVTAAVAVKEGATRPAEGVKSAALATIAYQQLLRAYIGLNKTDLAIAQMKTLQQIGGKGNTAVFVDLGRQIKKELEALPQGAERSQRMASFDRILTELAKVKQGQTFGSLVWIGETYFGLAQAAVDPKRSQYFNRAAQSFQTILSRAKEPNFLPSQNAIIAVKLRLATVTDKRGQYSKAYDLVRQVLKEVPTSVDSQVAAAEILRDWGLSGRPEAPEKLKLSIVGDEKGEVPIWGWGGIARRLQRAIYSGQDSDNFREIYRQARYEIPFARWSYAKTRSNKEQFNDALGKAEKELLSYVATTPQERIGSEWWPRFEQLYADIQRSQGKAVLQDLEPAEEYHDTADSSTTETEQTASPAPNDVVTSKAAPETEPAEEDGGMLPILFGLLLAGGVGGGLIYTLVRGGKKSVRRATPDRLPDATFSPPGADPKRSRSKHKSERRSKSAEVASTQERDPAAAESKPRKAKRPRVTGDRPPGKSAAPREASSSNSSQNSSQRSKSSPSEGAGQEAPRVVKPRVVKKVRRTKPEE